MDINKGINHLRFSDPLLAEVIDTYPPPTLKRTNNLFESRSQNQGVSTLPPHSLNEPKHRQKHFTFLPQEHHTDSYRDL